jgi:hypothetical protein
MALSLPFKNLAFLTSTDHLFYGIKSDLDLSGVSCN